MNTPTITDEQIAELERDAIARNSLRSGQCEGGHTLHSTYACGVCGAGPQDGCWRPLPASYNNPPAVIALINRLRAAEMDAARYRFIRDAYELPMNIMRLDMMGAMLDKAVDAAMTLPEPNSPA